jgi:hypothetical protein
MNFLTSSIHLFLYALLITSGVTVIFLVLALALRRRPQAARIGQLVKISGIITSVGALLLSIVNVTKPIGIAPPPDEAKETIVRFYDAIQDRNFDTAYRLIHPARLDEIRERRPSFGRDALKELYSSTREYRNKLITPVEGLTKDPSARVYHVSFDVSDEVPRNRLFESRQAMVRDFVEWNIIDEKALIASVVKNLREFYKVPDGAEPAIRDYVLSRQFESVLDPLFLLELRRNLSDQVHIDLGPHGSNPSAIVIWRHFLADVEVLKDDNNWKIRQGLGQPKAVANYLPSSVP